MDIVLLIFRLLLAAVFGVAAVGKLEDRYGTRQAIINFGVPESLAGSLGWLLPLAELIVAVLLIPVESAWWGAAGALALLLVFIAGIGVNLARGNKPDCHCFGQIHSAPIGWRVVARNVLLAAVAGFIVWQGRGGAGLNVLGWLRGISKGELAVFVVGVAVLGVLSVVALMLGRVLKQQGQMLERLDELEMSLDGRELPAAVRREEFAFDAKGLPVGAPAPEFSLKSLEAREISLDTLLDEKKPVLLLFVSPSCGPCVSLLPEIKRWQRDYLQAFTLALVSRSSVEDNRKEFDGQGLKFVLLQREAEVADEYQAKWTPCAVLVKADGSIGSQLALGVEAIKALVSHAASANAARPWLAAKSNHNGHEHAGADAHAGLVIGADAPPVKLPDLAGETFDLKQFRAEKTMLLFWNPDCTFCQQMLGELKEFEKGPPKGAPKLLIVSQGTLEANRAMGLSSPILLDEEFSVGKLYGAHGTPSAVLIDSEGRIASVVAAGAPDVLALAGVRAPSRSATVS
ncbi:MAG: MauE/DoxX family redox-associated membrane protein [Pyrinomonadaceae bacterium]